MIIENPDQFKSWLTRVLEPLCEADPAALSKYVYALVKKDKPQETLREEILDQLDVFLLNETKNFVDILFNALESNDYMKPQENEVAAEKAVVAAASSSEPAASKSTNANGETAKLSLDDQIGNVTDSMPIAVKSDVIADVRFDRIKPVIPVSSLPNLAESLALGGGTGANEKDGAVHRDNIGSSLQSASADYRKSRGYGYHHQSRQRATGSANRSRSRSRERQRRSRERSTRAAYRGGAGTGGNRSPTRQRYEKRRGSRSPSPVATATTAASSSASINAASSSSNNRQFRASRSRSRSRSRTRSKSPRPQSHRGNRYRNHRSYSRSRSPSFDRKSGCGGMKRSRSTTPPGVDSTNNKDTHHSFGNETKKKRCRDYETRGFCVRGDMCQYDHGMDAVVIRNAAALGFGAGGASNGVGGPPGLNDDMFIPSIAALNKSHRFPEYNPSAPGMWAHGANAMFRPGLGRPQPLLMPGPPPGTGAAGAQPPPPPPGAGPFNAAVQMPLTHPLQQQQQSALLQRELVSVPVLDNNDTAAVAAGADHSNAVVTPLNQPNFPMNSYPYPPPPIGLARDNQQMYKTPFFGVHHNGLQKKKNFDYNRLGPKKQHQTNCSLELKKIPTMQNNIAHLNDHFAKFGKIINIQVSYEGDPESALITFSNHYEANAAYKSTEPILNNRFIKVFWHKNNETQPDSLRPEENQTSGGGGGGGDDKKPSGSESGANAAANASDGKTAGTVSTTATTTTSSVPPKSALVYQNYSKKKLVLPSTDKLVKINNIAGHAKTKTITGAVGGGGSGANNLPAIDTKTSQLAIDLRKRKQDLLDKQLEQQKLLLERLEKPDLSECNRKTLMKTIITVQKSIEEIRKELMPQGAAAAVAAAVAAAAAKPTTTATTAASSASIATVAAVKKLTKEEAQKEVLDVELELINKQQEGQDTTALQKKLNLLKIQAGILLGRKPLISSSTKLVNNSSGVAVASSAAGTIDPKKITRFPSRSALSKNNIAPSVPLNKLSGIKKSKYSFQKTNVDNRPSTIGISGFELDECDTVLKNFKTFGLIDKHSLDESIPCLKLTYKNRKDAEKAMQNNIVINDRLLTVAWQQTQPHQQSIGAGAATAAQANSAASVKAANRIAVLKKRLNQVMLKKQMHATTARTRSESGSDGGATVPAAAAAVAAAATAADTQNVVKTSAAAFKDVVTNVPDDGMTTEASTTATSGDNRSCGREPKIAEPPRSETTNLLDQLDVNDDADDVVVVDDVPDDCLLENYSEEVLLQDDEEEDEESAADRSWKR